MQYQVRACASKGNDRIWQRSNLAKGPIRESNPGPPAPEAGIMPLDQLDFTSSVPSFLVHNQTLFLLCLVSVINEEKHERDSETRHSFNRNEVFLGKKKKNE
jgi:hypothetical protein